MKVILVAFGSIALIITLAATWMTSGTPEKTMDVTIYVKASVLKGGGTVVVLPKEVAPGDNTGKPTSVEIDDDFSIVQVDYPRDRTWTLHFRASPDGEPSARPLRTKRVSLGTSTYIDEHGQMVQDAPVDIYHVFGTKITEQETYSRGTFFDRFIQTGLHCTPFAAARVCVPKNKGLDIAVH